MFKIIKQKDGEVVSINTNLVRYLIKEGADTVIVFEETRIKVSANISKFTRFLNSKDLRFEYRH